jgi:hypothetical protein
MAEKPPLAQQLPDVLAFHPEWWWDPVPWPWLREQLDPRVIRELAVVQIELRKAALEANLKATQKTLEILQKAK